MDGRWLEMLKRRVRPVDLRAMLSRDDEGVALALNRDIATFHAALGQAERVLELAGALDGRLKRELAVRAIELTRERGRVTMGSAGKKRRTEQARSSGSARVGGDRSATTNGSLPHRRATSEET